MGEGSEHPEQAGPWKVFRSFLASVLRRHWNYRNALGISAIFAGGVGLYGYGQFQSYQAQHTYEREKAAKYQTYKISQNISGPKLAIPGIQETPPPKTGDYATYYDLKAQQDMAEWTYSMLWVGIVGLLASIVGIGFVYANLREMQAQTLATREIGENQSKAYAWVREAHISFPSGSSPEKGRFRLSGAPSIKVNLKAQNEGETPAMDVTAWATLQIFSNSGNALAPIKLEYEGTATKDPKVRVITKNSEEPLWLFIPDEREPKLQNAPANALDPQSWAVRYGAHRYEIQGILQYRDVFGHWYHSAFKFFGSVNADGEFNPAYRSEEPEILFLKVEAPRLPDKG